MLFYFSIGGYDFMNENFTEILRRGIHPVLLFLMSKQRKFDLIVEGNVPELEPVIFVANHYDIHDIPVAGEVIKKHSYILVSDEDKPTFDGRVLDVNGVIWVNRLSKESRRESREQVLRHLHLGHNVLVYPEATWNLSPNLLMLPMNYGVIDMALSANVPIVPLVTHYSNNTCYAKIGDLFYPTTDKALSILQLRDIMATYKYELMERYSQDLRKNISDNYLEEDIADRYSEYARARKDQEGVRIYESQFIFKPKDLITAQEAFAHLGNIDYCQGNAFLLTKHNDVF